MNNKENNPRNNFFSKIWRTTINFLKYLVPPALAVLGCVLIERFCLFGTNLNECSSLTAVYVAIISLVGIFSTYLINKKSTFSDIVTKARLEWISEVKTIMAEFYETLIDQENKCQRLKKHGGKLPKNESTNVENDKFMNEMYANSKLLKKTVNILTLYFNPNSEEDQKIIKELDDLVNYVSIKKVTCNDESEFKTKCTDFSNLLSTYLKIEWDRVKEESR